VEIDPVLAGLDEAIAVNPLELDDLTVRRTSCVLTAPRCSRAKSSSRRRAASNASWRRRPRAVHALDLGLLVVLLFLDILQSSV
jgi:hypothetical protein